MSENVHILRRVLRSTALCSALTLLAAPAFAQSFDPNAGAESTTTTTTKPARDVTKLPSTAPLISPMPRIAFPSAVPTVPSSSGASPLPLAAVTAPIILSPQAASAAPTVGSSAYVAPVAVAAAAAPAPQFPAVDPAVAAQAQREIQAQRTYIAPPPNFSPPAPLPANPIAAPVVAAAPVAVVPVIPSSSVGAIVAPPSIGAVSPQPVETSVGAATIDTGLSASSKAILHKLPAKLSSTKAPVGGKLDVSRMSPAVNPIGETDQKVQSYDAVGLSIKVARPGLDTNFELNRAYTALMGGDTETAIATYKNILTSDPGNQDALFGLAATYHRLGKLEEARPYYGQLLKVNPTHREGLNNFLALVGEESPNEALVELARLEQNNPDFSPIPAQESIVLNKLGYYDQARDKLLRAIELAPDNLTYRYNLAVMFDHHGDYADAVELYKQLIEASLRGEKLPATTETLQKRLNYIAAASAPQPQPGS